MLFFLSGCELYMASDHIHYPFLIFPRHMVWCTQVHLGASRWLGGKRTLQCRRHRFDLWPGKIPWRRAWQPTCLENPMDRGAWWAEYIQSQRVRHDWSDLAYIHMVISRGKTKIKIDWIKEIKLQNLFYSSGQTSNQFQEDEYTHTHTPVWTLDELFKLSNALKWVEYL